MRNIKTFEAFLNEEEPVKGKEGGEEKAPAEPKAPSIDKDKPRLMDFEINGKKYKGVLSTFEAIAKKQEAMGQSEVGVISLPGDEAAYEIFSEEKPEGGEEKKEEGGEETPSI